MIDHLSALITFLENQSDLTDEVGTRLYGPNGIPPASEGGPSMPQKALVVLPDGGAPLSTENIEYQVRATMHCYGATHTEAHTVYRALADVLHGKKQQDIDPGTGVGSGSGYNNRLLIARQTDGPRASHEPYTEWPKVLVGYEMVWIRDEIDSY